MTIRFSRPDSGDDPQKLSECTYIRFETATPCFAGSENYHPDIYVKGDRETAEEPEISVVFEYRAEAGGELLQTPKLSFPVLSR